MGVEEFGSVTTKFTFPPLVVNWQSFFYSRVVMLCW